MFCMEKWLKVTLVAVAISIYTTTGLPPCDSQIWCQGRLLDAVQRKPMYDDSKTFVDMNLKDEPVRVLTAYQELAARTNQTPSKADLRDFIDKYFEGPNTEFENWTPTDLKEEPAFLKNVKDENLRQFGKALCKKWAKLGRKIKRDVRDHQERYSLIYLENPFIVPGGRFRETYYWDSYWVVKGLLACEMTTTVKGMLENFVSLVDKYGMVPNGNRIYYSLRSQPPFLTPMVKLYLDSTSDTDFLRRILPSLNREYEFWTNNRSVDCCPERTQKITVNRYAAPFTMPRPESYKEDIETAKSKADKDKNKMYQNLASGAESGWDFSSRWFSEHFQSDTSDETRWLQYTDTTDVIPVDLNSILCWNEMLLSMFYKKTGNTNMSDTYMLRHHNRMNDVDSLFWDEAEGAWFDITLSSNSKRKRFFPSNVYPLFAMCNKHHGADSDKVLKYLKQAKVLDYVSGVPTSRLQTGQQWDFPNAWPPLQDVVVSALINTNLPEGREAALELANRWVSSNYIGWKRTNGNMFEKYVVTDVGSRGSGGEYDVQEGFGWTNGVVLDFLVRFGQELSLESSTSGAPDKLKLQPLNLCIIFVLITVLFSY